MIRLLTRKGERSQDLPGMWLLLVAIPVAALPHTWEQPLWVTAAFLGAWLWRVLIHATRARLPASWLLVTLVFAGGGLTAAEYGTVFGQQAGTALLLVMVALKLLEIRSQRDVVVTLFLAYFVVVTTYFFNQSIGIAAYSLLSIWLITAALILVHAGRTLPFSRLAWSSATMLIHALPIMLILFLIFPRVPAPIWGSPEQDQTGRTGLSERLEPGDIARLLENDATALRVRFDGPPPGSSQQYWRAMVMTDFDGRTWRVDRGRPEIPHETSLTADIRYTAMLESTGANYLPMLEFPVEIPAHASLLDNLQVVQRQRVLDRLQYSGGARLVSAGTSSLSIADRERALALPSGAAPRARTQAGLWRAIHGDDDQAIVRQALERFSGEPFRYTLRPPRLTGDYTDAFLFETHAGYCEHFASTFAVLMRAAGIPSRVIVGYQGGQWMDAGNYLHLRQADAHAWTEVWLDETGWTRVDPTAAIAPERIETGLTGWVGDDADAPAFLRRSGLSWGVQWRLRASDWHDMLTFRWESLVLAFDPERQRELFAHFGLDATDWRSILIALGVSFGGLAILAALVVLWRRPPDQRDCAQRALDRLSNRLRAMNLARETYETMGIYAARVRATQPHLATPLRDFSQAYTHLRFADLDANEDERYRRQIAQALREINMRLG